MPGYSCDDDTLNPQAQFYPGNIVVNKKWMLRLGSYKKNHRRTLYIPDMLYKQG